MLPLHTVIALAAFSFVASITPGPNNLMLMASGTNFGFARTGPHMAGVAIGFAFVLWSRSARLPACAAGVALVVWAVAGWLVRVPWPFSGTHGFVPARAG